MRPFKIASCVVVGGCLAALPFYRSVSTDPAAPPQRLDTGPGTEAVAWELVGRSRPQPVDGDLSLAWQPIPMVLPQTNVVEQPPMPNSYYDAAIPWEQPDPIRERFSATVAQTESRSREPRVEPQVEEFREWAKLGRSPRAAADPTAEMIEDRFVFEPIEPLDPFPAAARPPQGSGPGISGRDGTPIQNASLGRGGQPPTDDANRPRYFIREPD